MQEPKETNYKEKRFFFVLRSTAKNDKHTGISKH